MTISSSLNASVAGLNANANRLATIADNIANSSTYGYKRATTDFHSMVTQGNSRVNYSAGGVRTTNMRLIDARGPLIGTSNSTDIAIDGRGFFAVSSPAGFNATYGTYQMALMTTGSFRPDSDGILRSESGHVLMGWPDMPDGTVAPNARTSLTGLEPINVNTNQYAANPTTKLTLGVNLPATATKAGAASTPFPLPIEYFGNLGSTETLDIQFTPTVPATGASNAWTMDIRDSASGGALVGSYTLTFDQTQATGGRLLSVVPISGGAYNSATGDIAVTVGGGTINVNVGIPGQTTGLTQLSSTFAPVTITKDGSSVASLASVEIDEQGFLYAIYDLGVSRKIYQIPVVDVPNPNDLIALSSQTYTVSHDSGDLYLWDAGDGPAGTIAGFSLEESGTDVAAELTQLIKTQRAYSSNAKVIQTVDEMLQETTNIKR
ncbi:MAG: hypothetical protein RIR95_1930 [Pseudomonadota bacterium]